MAAIAQGHGRSVRPNCTSSDSLRGPGGWLGLPCRPATATVVCHQVGDHVLDRSGQVDLRLLRGHLISSAVSSVAHAIDAVEVHDIDATVMRSAEDMARRISPGTARMGSSGSPRS